MPWIRSFRHLGLWVAFIENDLHEMSCTSFGFTRDNAERRAYNKLCRREVAGVDPEADVSDCRDDAGWCLYHGQWMNVCDLPDPDSQGEAS